MRDCFAHERTTCRMAKSTTVWWRPRLLVLLAALSTFSRAAEAQLIPDRSKWEIRGDTFHLRVFDGLVGWDVAAVRDSLGYAGIASYLSDVVVAGMRPHRMPVHLEPIACPSDRRQD